MAFHEAALPKPLRIVRNHIRLVSAAVGGFVLVLAMPDGLRLSTRLLIGWDAAAAVYLTLAFATIPHFDIKRVQIVAEERDEGGLLILILSVAAAVASLAAIVVELGAARAAQMGNEAVILMLAVVTAALSWTLIHTIFAFRYAHEFYREPGERGSGLVFPQDDWPNYWDFIYFSFVIGMTFQVSDVQVTNKRVRRIVVAHGIVSFVFDVAIIALVVNIGANFV